MNKEDEIQEAAEELGKYQLQLSRNSYTYDQLRQDIAERINYLITNDFSLLISVLYRLDISEKKLKQLLIESINATAGDVIASMIIERQLQKIHSRKTFRSNPADIPDDDKW